ncbi:MAG: helix-turn-helix transcriptional regulator [Chitinophagaceae bacterium]|nr:helix-turn-helix transcriptional regulator [Chitinophagaceae bacterium]
MSNLKNKDLCQAFGAHIKALRKEKGISLRAMALEADIEHSQLSKIERGIGNPTISTVYALSIALEISLKELMDFKFPSKTRTSK